MGHRFAVLFPFSILNRPEVTQSSSKGWKLSLQQKLQYTKFRKTCFWEQEYNCSFFDRGRSNVMISCSVLSSSKVAQCSCKAWLQRF